MKPLVICFVTIFLISIGLGQDICLTDKFLSQSGHIFQDEYKPGINIDKIKNLRSYKEHRDLTDLKTNIESIKVFRNNSYPDKRIKKLRMISKKGNYRKVIDFSQNWDGGQWVNNRKWTYTYDENNNLTEELYQKWVDSDWQNLNKRMFEYFTTTGLKTLSSADNSYSLSQNYPNPFNPSTTIEFDLPKSSDVKIEVYNIAGQRIQILLNEKMSAGSHNVEFNAQNLSSGVYFYRIDVGQFQDVKKMILLR